MKKELLPLVLMGFAILVTGSTRAEDGIFFGKFSVEGGVFQNPSDSIQPYQLSRLFLASHPDLTQTLSLGLEGQAEYQSAFSNAPFFVPRYPINNLIKLQTDNLSSDPDGDNFYDLQLDRAYLHFASGPVEINAGLFKPDWGSSFFYRPTDYFFPLPPLVWVRDEPLGSEGLDAKWFLFDDFSVEGAVRWLEGGTSEEVLRLVNRGIGITVTPSFAWLTGRNGFGLEVAGTFPDFKVWVEGVDWFFTGGTAKPEWVAGFSTIKKGTTFKIEALQDTTGGVLGAFSNRAANGTYLSISAEREFKQVKADFDLVAPVDGGPFLFWPKIHWDITREWKLALQAQWPIGNEPGQLALVPGQTGLSGSFSF